MSRFTQSLRGKVLLVLIAVVLIPFLGLGALGLTAVRGLSGFARTQTRQAFDLQLRSRLISRVQERARAEDALFQGVLSQAVSLGRYTKWYYDFPQHRPAPGFLRGGSELLETPQGHRVNRPDTPVGVFVSRRTEMVTAVWEEVGALSFADPLLVSIGESTPGAARVWVTSASRILRIYPNLNMGHTASPVGPDYDVTADEPFQAAAPERNPHQLPVWTAPYPDPSTGELMITAVAPVYDAGGTFRAVSGVDMRLTDVIAGVLREQAAPGEYAVLLDWNAQVISAPAQGIADLGLPGAPQARPGRALAAELAQSRNPGVRSLAGELQGVTAPGLATIDTDAGRRLVAYAPLPATGWVLALVAPAEEVEAAAGSVLAGIRRLEVLSLIGGALVLPLALVLVSVLALRASRQLTRPVDELVAGTQRLATDLSHRLPDLEPREFSVLARAFNAMAESLAASQAEAVRHARLVVEERNRLAREIHDTIAQGLTGIVVHLETTEAILGEAPDPQALKHLQRARQLARENLQEARRSVWNLRPSAVAESGLPRALEQLAAGMSQDGFECLVEAESVPPLPSGTEDALYRVCQEALANVRKHSGARRVWLRLQGAADQVCLEVQDDGTGFDPAAAPAGPGPEGGFGLWAMRERLEHVGGRLQVETAAGQGTTVRATVPVQRS